MQKFFFVENNLWPKDRATKFSWQTRKVAIQLRYDAGASNLVYRTTKQLCTETGLYRETVTKALRLLQEHGTITSRVGHKITLSNLTKAFVRYRRGLWSSKLLADDYKDIIGFVLSRMIGKKDENRRRVIKKGKCSIINSCHLKAHGSHHALQRMTEIIEKLTGVVWDVHKTGRSVMQVIIRPEFSGELECGSDHHSAHAVRSAAHAVRSTAHAVRSTAHAVRSTRKQKTSGKASRKASGKEDLPAAAVAQGASQPRLVDVNDVDDYYYKLDNPQPDPTRTNLKIAIETSNYQPDSTPYTKVYGSTAIAKIDIEAVRSHLRDHYYSPFQFQGQ